MKKCLDEATIQAYADGELEAAASHAAEAHLAHCGACAAALAGALHEQAFFAAAFAPDADVSVPTEALRARLDAAVARLADSPEAPSRSRGWDFGALLAPFTGLFSFTPQRAAAFASVLALVAFAVVFYAVRQRTTPPVSPREQVAQNNPGPSRPAASVAPGTGPAGASDKTEPDTNPVEISNRARVVKAPAPRRTGPSARRPAANVAVKETPAPTPAPLVPGEQNYREAIASLEKVVEAGADAVLVPSARIEYERNLAVLDRAIEETRRAALRNPKDKDSVGFLMAAYQSKVELLSTVAEQAQIAAVGR